MFFGSVLTRRTAGDRYRFEPGGALADVAIRKAAVADSGPVARLVSELGYPTSASQMQRRLDAILHDDDYHTLVACQDGQVVGFVGTRVGPLYEDDGPYGQIMALAVAPTYQRRGIGRMLMQAAESTLVDAGARVLVVTSGNHRAGAHAFYESCGYSFTGRRYKKSLAMSA
jgi:ribosomal protein S18 acetylase RimI-like enzyme